MEKDILQLNKDLKSFKEEYQEHYHGGIDGTVKLLQTSFITFNLPSTAAQTAANYGLIFTATRPCFVKAISEKHTIAGTDAGAVSLQVERLQDTTALGAGTNLLETAFNLKGTAYTTQRGVLASLKTTSALNLGDSLAVKTSGVLTTLQGVQVTIELAFY